MKMTRDCVYTIWELVLNFEKFITIIGGFTKIKVLIIQNWTQITFELRQKTEMYVQSDFSSIVFEYSVLNYDLCNWA